VILRVSALRRPSKQAAVLQSVRASVVWCWREGVHRVSMGTHHPADDEISVRSLRGSVECQTTEFPRRPVSVIRLVAGAGEPKSTEDSSRSRAGDPLEGSRTMLMERQCCSTRPDKDPESGRSLRHAEQHSVGVDSSTDDPGMRQCATQSTRRGDRTNSGV